MNVGRWTAVVLSLLVVTTAANSGPLAAAADPTCRHVISQSVGSTCSRTLEWRYDPIQLAFVRSGDSDRDLSGVPAKVRYDWERRERCDEHGATCAAAALTCTRRGERGYRYADYGYRLDAIGHRVPGPAEIITTECVWPEQVVTASEVEAVVAQDVRKRVGRPSIATAPPGGRTLVNIPTIYSTQRFGQIALPVTAPVPGAITAVPEWEWHFPDGSTGLGPGTPYDAAVDPLADPDHYVHTVYRTAGEQRVRLTLTWRVAFRLEDVLDVDLAPITFTRTATTTALSAKNQLVDGPG